ncbi:MAG: 16S rRNA (guanine(527)-N(7))-methyltransferase RsmG [Deltaproteobacteria bacterium RBG_19FT_COMBO_46_9]|nr:MAG: 16S rRNA (guanine(527)-N(7))-methyltransferase RsmG [Deltaproteobacteria bacterium RBG_19FT_COMBO_46_9]
MDEKEKRLLSEKALDFGIDLSQRHLDLFGAYMDELLEWNRRINLTGLSERKRIIIELFLDSLIPTPFIPEKGRMLDVGSGAGFPGIVIKVCRPHLKTCLMEANSRKTSFLKQVVRLLKLSDVDVVNGRIESDKDKLHPDGYHFITARALAGPDRIITWCSPFLCSGGLLITFLGSGAVDELEKCGIALETNFLVVDRLIPYSLPGMRSGRTLALLRKVTSQPGPAT